VVELNAALLAKPVRRNRLAAFVEQRWYSRPGWLWLLCPFEYLFRGIAYYRKKILTQRQTTSPLPVIVVGNISVGGTGKTPVIIALAQYLRDNGFKPGVISRGYGRTTTTLHCVGPSSTAANAGDEPLEIYQATRLPVIVSADRRQAVQYLAESGDCTIVLADDGLQHYTLPRALEIVVLDGDKMFGNGHCMPVGPLREPVSRLGSVDEVLVRGGNRSLLGASVFQFLTVGLTNVKSGEKKPLNFLCSLPPFYAVAGIGNPQKFYTSLNEVGQLHCAVEKPLRYTACSFPDHYTYSEHDFTFANHSPIVMTAKDAVKCQAFAQDNWWCLNIQADLPEPMLGRLLEKIRKVTTDVI